MNASIYTGYYLAKLNRGASSNSASYVEGLLKARLDRTSPQCTPKSVLCGEVCVPKSKRCRKNQTTKNKSKWLSKINDVEKEIRSLPYERAVVVDPRGKVLIDKKGNKTSVGFTQSEFDAIKNTVVTHNHPNLGWSNKDERSRGLSFSNSDLELASTGEVAQIRAVSSGYTHTLSPANTGWNQKYWDTKLSPTYKKHEREVYQEFSRKIITGRMKLDSGEANYHHEVISRTSTELGLNYQRIPV